MCSKRWIKVLFFLFSLDIALYGMYITSNNSSVKENVSAGIKDSNDRVEIIDKKVALTFDDGPESKYTKKLLDGLKEENIKATFFVTGKNAEENPDLVKRMHSEGHIIGNHTYNHVQLTTADCQKACKEVDDTNDLLENLTGTRPIYIRPPFGCWSDKMKCAPGMKIVLWNVDPTDWCINNVDRVSNHIVKKVKPGDIILLHDIFETSVDAAFIVIQRLKEEGYRFVTIDELTENEKIRWIP